jgi:hypothetical protein
VRGIWERKSLKMKFKDHKNISFYLVKSQERRIKARNMWALVIGSVIPDITVYTYLRGSLSGKKLKGHNYENTSVLISDLIERISNSHKYGIWRYFTLGKLLHYSADSFTYAHNSRFTGTLSEHRAYEMELHERLEEAMVRDSDVTSKIGNERSSDMCAKIRELHEAYSQKTPDSRNDCRYIMYVMDYLYKTLGAEGAAAKRNVA